MRIHKRLASPSLIMVAAVRADGTADDRKGRTGPVKSASDAQALTARVDAVLAARWAEAKVRPAAVADDGEFLRRVSLDLIGKIPTAAEARDFLDDPSKGKRLALVERLLDSPAYTTRATEIWRELLLPEADTEDVGQAGRGQLRGVASEEGDRRGGLRSDRPRDPHRQAERSQCRLAVMARARSVSRGLLPAKESKPENLAAGVARVFLGIRLECAQCHNHPFASWKREQFWSLAAFFAEMPPEEPEDAVIALPRPRCRPAQGADDPGDQEGRQGVAPRRFHAGMAAARRHARDSGRVGHRTR